MDRWMENRDRDGRRTRNGAGIASFLAAAGATVAVLDLDGAEAERTAASLTVPGIGIAYDVAEDAAAAAGSRRS